jgi:hypothetical protein
MHSHACYMQCLSPPRLYHSNYVWQGLQVSLHSSTLQLFDHTDKSKCSLPSFVQQFYSLYFVRWSHTLHVSASIEPSSGVPLYRNLITL